MVALQDLRNFKVVCGVTGGCELVDARSLVIEVTRGFDGLGVMMTACYFVFRYLVIGNKAFQNVPPLQWSHLPHSNLVVVLILACRVLKVMIALPERRR